MSNVTKLVVLLSVFSMLVGCNDQEIITDAQAEPAVNGLAVSLETENETLGDRLGIARVNGQWILGSSQPQDLQSLINQELAAQLFQEAELEADLIEAEVAAFRRGLMAEAFYRDWASTIEIPAEEVEAAYQEFISDQRFSSYVVHSNIFQSRAEALKAKEDFEADVKGNHGLEPVELAENAEGTDVEGSSAGIPFLQLDPLLRTVAPSISKGRAELFPVNQGFLIVGVEDVMQLPVPSSDEIQELLVSSLLQERFQQVVLDKRSRSEILIR